MLSLLASLFLCQAVQWTTPLAMDANGNADGTIEATCSMEKVKGGSFEDLYVAMDRDIRGYAKVEREWEDVPVGTDLKGRQYQARWTVARAGETIAMHGYLGIWRSASEFVFDAHSNDVIGTGPAKNIKELYPRFWLKQTGDDYEIRFSTRMVVEKPAALPKKKFLDIVKREAEAEMKDSQAEWILKLQETL